MHDAAGPFLLGIDLGAGSLKATIIDLDGAVAGDASHPVSTRSPAPGWSEQDPGEWWQAVCAAVPRALAAGGIDARRIAGISVSAGAHTQVLEDGDGKVIRPAIMWNDQRSRAETMALRARADARILELGHNRANPTWTLPQMAWVKAREPEAFARVRRLYLAKDWLRSRLTGGFETDPVDAVGALMADGATLRWSAETLPPIVDSTAIAGRVSRAAAAATGLVEGTPVVCGASDTAVETYGAGMTREGIGCLKLATAATVSVLSRGPVPDFELINYPHIVPDHWYVIVGTNSCASAHRWVRDNFFMAVGGDGAAAFAEMDRRAGEVAPGCGGLFFHPFLNGERSPYWDPLLRADFIGMGFDHGPGHFARAVYEGIAYSLRDCLEVFRARGLGFDRARITGGGARSPLWRQIVADTLGVSVELPAVADASFGAALVAGIGVGAYADPADAAARAIRIVARAEPDPARAALYARGFEIYRESQAALAAINHRIHDFRIGAAS